MNLKMGESVEKIKALKCSKCGDFVGLDVMYHCPKCGVAGTLDVIFDIEVVKKKFTKEYLLQNDHYHISRYQPMLPLQGYQGIAPLKLGFSPLYKSLRLENLLNIRNIYFKDEGRNPTGSLKDRASAIGVAKAIELNKKVMCAASTGNAASSLSGFAACLDIENYIFVPKTIPDGKLAQLLIYGSKVILVDGDYDTAYDFCLEAVEHFGWYNRSCAINPYLVDGKKTIAYEICEQLAYQVPDKIIMAVGDGCSIAGAWKGFKEFYELGFIDKLPTLVSVQAEGSNPINRTFRKRSRTFDYIKPDTIADSISVGIPRNGYKALNALEASNGWTVDVSDEEILEAMKILARITGVFGEPAGVASFAGLRKLVAEGKIGEDETVLFVVSGSGLKDIKSAERAVLKPEPIKTNLDVLINYLNK